MHHLCLKSGTLCSQVFELVTFLGRLIVKALKAVSPSLEY